MQMMVTNKGKEKSSVAVFSVKQYTAGTNPTTGRAGVRGVKSSPNQTSLSFGAFDFDPKTEYGELDLSTGLFKVKKAGIYHFEFNAHMKVAVAGYNSGIAYTIHVELRVNGKTRAVAYRYDGSGSGANQSVVLVDLVPLKPGDEVGVFLVAGSISEDGITYITRFSGVFHG